MPTRPITAPAVRALLLSLAFLIAAPAFSQGSGRPLLSHPEPILPDQVPDSARARAALAGTLDPHVLEGPAIEVALPDGRTVTARLQRIARDRGQVQTWIGTFDDEPGSLLALSRVAGVVSGFATIGTTTLELRAVGDGRHLLYEVDLAGLPTGDIFTTDLEDTADGLGSTSPDALSSSSSSNEVTATGATIHDVLILYTAAAANQWGPATLEGMIRSGVQAANQAYQNSVVRVALNVVALKQTALKEAGSLSATVDALRSDSTVRSMRDSLGADMVVLVGQNSDGCGVAKLSHTISGTVSDWDAYAAVYSSCLSNQSLAHEIGHLQQLDHNRENATGVHAYDYSYGYRRCVTGGFRDIMSYPCSGDVPRVNYFSNPDLTYNGYPMGISYYADPAHAADAARSLNDTATLVASYRATKTTSSGTVPAAPTSLAKSSARYDKVSLTWADNSSDETGFRIQRSRDGKSFATLGTTGAGARSYTDTTVSPRTTYYYRVQAYNGAGGSGFSNVVKVWTPDAPPAAPSSVTASNNGNGTATVKWADLSGNETRFDIRRARYDWKTGTWLASSVIATVGANVTRYVDACGKGKYRYLVRAANSGGVSKYAGPAVVTVTGG